MARVLGISGLIGSGKSVVREALTVLYDMPCFDSDTVAKKAYFDQAVVREIENLLRFSPVKSGQLDKIKLREALSDPQKKTILEEIVHRTVAKHFEEWRDKQSSPWVCIESAILFTSGFNSLCDVTLSVEAPDEIRHQRVLQRDSGRSIADLQKIEEMQAEEGRRQRGEADIKIDNSGTTSISRAVEALWERITNI